MKSLPGTILGVAAIMQICCGTASPEQSDMTPGNRDLEAFWTESACDPWSERKGGFFFSLCLFPSDLTTRDAPRKLRLGHAVSNVS